MDTVFVQFGDSNKTVIVGYMGSPQDPDAFANQDKIGIDDPRWKSWYESQPSHIQQAVLAPANEEAGAGK